MFTAAKSSIARIALLGAVVLVSACSTPSQPDGINDPFEQTNRQTHEFNRGVDRIVLRPTSNAYGTVVPERARNGIANFANTLNQPADVVNSLLQGRVENAGHSTFRFLVNAVFGLGGVLDPATDMGLEDRDTDFGETLYVWGVPEGVYGELPIVGPVTERHAAGKVVDLFTNPLSTVLEGPQAAAQTAANVASGFGTRYRLSDTIDSILYDSADSYAQARLIYLQNRRFKLGVDSSGTDLDPFEDPYDSLSPQ
ncbi:MAG: VacJ family lipoprotein [Pseudomonadota bacterium]